MDNSLLDRLVDTRCSFCDPIEELIVSETHSFRVLLALGPIEEGYALIMPREHVMGLSNLPIGDLDELRDLKREVRKVYKRAYDLPVVMYEHGGVGVCSVEPGEQLCYHAHLHVLPTEKDLLHRLEDDFTTFRLGGYRELSRMYEEYGHYLLYENRYEEAYYVPVQRPIRRQYLRSLAATELGKPERVDWKLDHNWPEIRAAKRRLAPLFGETAASHGRGSRVPG